MASSEAPEIVEAEFVIGAVSDVGGVGVFALPVVHLVLNAADGETKKAINLAHPLGVAPREIIVDGDDMHAAAG